MKTAWKLLALLCILLAVGVSSVFAGGKSEASGQAASGQKLVLGFSQIGAESEWRTANTESIKQSAKDFGIDLKFSDAQQKQENQIKAIRSFIAQKVDVIAFSPVVESGWETVLREAKAAGIPVILSDRAVDVKDDSLWVTFMGSDFVEEGRRAANWLVDYMKTDKPVNIVELQGTVGSAPAIDRKVGFEEIMKSHPNYKIIRSQTGNFTRAEGKQVMEAFLKAEGKNIDVLYAHNDDMAIGAIQAIEEYGLVPGKDIVIVSIDGVKGAFEAMIAGKLNCSVECSPLLGPQLMQAALDLKAGKSLPKRIVTKEGVFPAEIAAKEFPNRKY
jgi:simple sugar transport system substrate-binding protein